MFWNFSHSFATPPHYPSLAALHLIGSHRCFAPTERFYDGNHFQIERGMKIANGFSKALGKKKKEFRQFLERKGKTHKEEGNEILGAKGGARPLANGLFWQPQTPCPELPLSPHLVPEAPSSRQPVHS